ncbi:hypothetical protein MPLDJ20_120526 [Mesorhizobium plurifarium]|uniref:Uncharacterized protein n=1 Tax=Mesorhizobium plurifarium TaxID=69974 RepID=A0A090EG62_MESPL|nr:hypothetical protein MPLDJ20_120526 [Mesorhizobium plurifarium]
MYGRRPDLGAGDSLQLHELPICDPCRKFNLHLAAYPIDRNGFSCCRYAVRDILFASWLREVSP